MATNEIELAGQLDTGLLPGGRLSLRFKRTWESRKNLLIEHIQQRTGMDESQLADALEQDEHMGDLYIGR